ncbi:MAG: CAP domain-containing protein [Actinomycetota bacterium]
MTNLSSASPRKGLKLFFKASALVIAVAVSFALAPNVQASGAADEAKSRDLVNQARSAAGLPTLAGNSGLDSIARAQAARMAERDAIYHNPNLKEDADAAGVNWKWIGENVGVGADIQAVHDAFMASPGHHQNIVYRDYNVIGVGVAVGSDGSVFVAHAFANVVSSAPVVTQTAVPVSVAPQGQAPAPQEPTVAPAPPTTRPKTVESVPPAVNAIVGGVVNTDPVF